MATPTSLVGAIPPLPPWAGNRYRPPSLKHGRCDRCGDITMVAWYARRAPTTQYPNALRIQDLCSWCWILNGWEQRARTPSGKLFAWGPA